MFQSSRTFRIFVSSTFSDLKTERNALQEKVFPSLRELAAAHGCRFQAIDLRWGVSEEAALDQQTMKICLGELSRCQKVSPRPNFIILLGNRYGWLPLPWEIPADEFDRIFLNLTKAEKPLALEWYHRDDNSIPAVYVLQPRTDEYETHAAWEQIETRLHAALEEAARLANLPESGLVKYQTSATEQEILQGAFQVADARENIFCFAREITELPEDEDAHDFRDFRKGKLDELATFRLANLKGRLKTTLGDNYHEYQTTWRNGNPSPTHIDQLCADVFAAIERVMLQEIGAIEQVDFLEKEISAHAFFGEERSRDFTGRENLLKQIDGYLLAENNSPLVIWGEPGSGKSALLAKAIQQEVHSFPQAVIVQRFTGATPNSSNIRSMLESLCRQITRAYQEKESDIPTGTKELLQEFPKRLGLARAETPLIIFIDAINQLLFEQGTPSLSWLPATLPPHVHLVISTTTGQVLEMLKQKLPQENLLNLGSLPMEEGASLLDKWLASAGRTLQPLQKKYLLGRFDKCSLPLYLKLASDEARRWKSYDPAAGLGEDIPTILGGLLDRLSQENQHGKWLVERSLAYLASAKNGLSEEELVDILSRDMQVYKWFLKRARHYPHDLIQAAIHYQQANHCIMFNSFDETWVTDWLERLIREDSAELDEFLVERFAFPDSLRLPVLLWSRLYYDLEPYLAERIADGTNLLTFYHGQVAEAVRLRYLTEGESETRHQALARFFSAQPLNLEKDGTRSTNLRKLSELPFQQAKGCLWEALERTLTMYAFLEAKVIAYPPYEIIHDFNLAYLPDAKMAQINVLRTLQKTLQLAAHILNQDTTQLPVQLVGRLLSSKDPGVQAILEQAVAEQERPWLRPISASISPPGGSLLFTLEGHESGVHAVAVSRDERFIISGSLDKTIKVWSLEDGMELITLSGHQDKVLSVALTSDGKRVISASCDKTLKIWDLSSGNEIATFEGHQNTVTSVVILPDGRRAVSGSLDKTLKVWDIERPFLQATLTGHLGGIYKLAATHTGNMVFSASSDNSIILWDVESGKSVKTYPNFDNVVGMAVSPDDKLLVVSTSNFSSSFPNAVIILDKETGKIIHVMKGHDYHVNAVAVTPDGEYVISGSEDSQIIIWHLPSGREIGRLVGHTGEIFDLTVSKDGKILISAATSKFTSTDDTLKVWDLEKGISDVQNKETEPLKFFAGIKPNLRVFDSQFLEKVIPLITSGRQVKLNFLLTGDGRYGITRHSRGLSLEDHDKVIVWDLPSGTELHQKIGSDKDVKICKFILNGAQILVTFAGDKVIRRYELAKGKETGKLVGHSGEIVALCITPDRTKALSVSKDHIIMLWDLLRMSRIRSFFGHNGEITCMEVTPDGSYLISVAEDDTLRIWNLNTGKLLRTLLLNGFKVRDMQISPDGNQVVLSQGTVPISDDFSLRVMDLAKGIIINKFEGHSLWVSEFFITDDDSYIISSSRDGTVRVWDLKNGMPVSIFIGEGSLDIKAISPDGRTIIVKEGKQQTHYLRLERF